MITTIYFIVTAIHLLFFILALRLFLRNRSIYTALVAIVIGGLFYDNLIIGLGSAIGEGGTLQALNAGRFYIHALATPTIIMFSLATAQRLGIAWAQSRKVFAAFGLLTVLMIALGIYGDMIDLALVAERESGTLRYINANAVGPPIPAVVTIVVMIVIGAFLWKRNKWAVLFLGSVLMLILAGAGASVLLLSNLGEIFFAAAILWTDYKLADLQAQMALPLAVPAG